MRLHASCAARHSSEGHQGVLLVGPPGSGKSDLTLRLLDRGFTLVADDQVEMDGLSASAPAALAGLLEVRGLGLLRQPFLACATLVLVIRLGAPPERMPMPARYDCLDLPMVTLDPFAASAPLLVGLALDHLQGRQAFATGAFG